MLCATVYEHRINLIMEISTITEGFLMCPVGSSNSTGAKVPVPPNGYALQTLARNPPSVTLVAGELAPNGPLVSERGRAPRFFGPP